MKGSTGWSLFICAFLYSDILFYYFCTLIDVLLIK